MKYSITIPLFFLVSVSAFAVSSGDEQQLYDAIIKNRVNVVRDYLLSGGSPDVLIARLDAEDPNASPPAPAIRLAMEELRPEIVKLLIEAGADWRKIFSSEVFFLEAVIVNGMEDVMSYFLETDPTVFATTGPPGDGPIELASVYGYFGLVAQMIAAASEAGLDIGDRLNVALLKSLAYGHEDIARLLLEHGADGTQPGALHLAVVGANVGMVRDLIKFGASVQENFQGASILDNAAARLRTGSTTAGGRQIVIELVSAGADVCSFIRDKDPSGKGLSIEERKELNEVLGLMASVSPDCDFHPFDLEPEVTPSSSEQ